MKDNSGHTPAVLADDNGHFRLRDYIEEQEAMVIARVTTPVFYLMHCMCNKLISKDIFVCCVNNCLTFSQNRTLDVRVTGKCILLTGLLAVGTFILNFLD